MSRRETGDVAAFPVQVRRDEKYLDERGHGRVRSVLITEGGMSMRDYFAAKAMQSLLSKCGPYEDDESSSNRFPMGKEQAPTVHEVALYAYAQAEAMMEQREC